MVKPTVGLTGGIASGKSTVARMFEGLGVPVVDADAIARQVVEPGQPAHEEIRREFGDGVLAPDGSIDRQKLGAIVFDDREARAKLNAITHPRIAERSGERMTELQKGDHPYVLYEAALLVENGAYKAFDALVVVAADRPTQVGRLGARDGLDATQARARMDSQLPLEHKVEVADYVIQNDGDLDETERQVRDVHQSLLELFGRRGSTR
ncbi:MAG: dephospho-CoA kinase [Myxococcota bacterium]